MWGREDRGNCFNNAHVTGGTAGVGIVRQRVQSRGEEWREMRRQLQEQLEKLRELPENSSLCGVQAEGGGGAVDRGIVGGDEGSLSRIGSDRRGEGDIGEVLLGVDSYRPIVAKVVKSQQFLTLIINSG